EGVAAGHTPGRDLTARGTAELGLVTRLLDLDLLHELLDQGRADGAERRVGDVGTFDRVLRLGAGGAGQRDAGRVPAGGWSDVDDGREVAAGVAADRELLGLLHADGHRRRRVGRDRRGLDDDLDDLILPGVEREVGPELGPARELGDLRDVGFAGQHLDRVVARGQILERVDAAGVGHPLLLTAQAGALQDDDRIFDRLIGVRVLDRAADDT